MRSKRLRGKVWRLTKKFSRKLLHKRKMIVLLPALFIILATPAVYLCLSSSPTKIHPQAYTVLLDTIAKGESKGNYNAYYGNAANTEIKLTQMSVGDVLRWQEEYVKGGSPSSAAGRYQIIRPTLQGLIDQLGLDRSELFNEGLQDRMAITLLERRGSIEFVDKKISRDEFAASLAKEWAALPKVLGNNPEQSYYAGDGLNKSHITIPEVHDALDQLKTRADQ